MGSMKAISENQLKRVGSWRELQVVLRLPSPKMKVMLVRRQRLIQVWQLLDIDHQVVVPGIGDVDAGGSYAHSLQPEDYGDRTRHFLTVVRRDYVNLRAIW